MGVIAAYRRWNAPLRLPDGTTRYLARGRPGARRTRFAVSKNAPGSTPSARAKRTSVEFEFPPSVDATRSTGVFDVVMWSGTVQSLCDMVDRGQQTAVLSALMRERGVVAGRFEERSWDQSLPALVDALEVLPIKDHHVVLECPMPGASTRADVVLLGEDPNGRRRVVVLELKQWRSAEGAGPEMVTWGTSPHLHPSSQVQGYRDYLGLYSAPLVDRDPESEVHGAAFLHEMPDVGPLAHGVGVDAVRRAGFHPQGTA